MSVVFLDSSYFKALIDEKDEFHFQAEDILTLLANTQSQLMTTNYIIDETATLLRVRCGLEVALKFRRLLATSTPTIKLTRVIVADDAAAWKWFIKDWSNLSFTDCVSFAVMKRLGLTHVATFDQHFQRAGFTIIKPDPKKTA